VSGETSSILLSWMKSLHSILMSPPSIGSRFNPVKLLHPEMTQERIPDQKHKACHEPIEIAHQKIIA
jgi:hypothetical protein